MKWSTTENLGQWATDGWLVNNNIWNSAEAGTQEMFVYSPHNWYVVANHSKIGARPGSIKSYPDTQRNFTDRTIDSFAEMTTSWATTYPAVGEWNGCFDIWIGGIGGKCTAELMVWTDYRYNGSLPPKNATESVRVTIDDREFIAWRRPLNAGDTRSYIALAMVPTLATGKLDLLKVFKWLVSKGWLKGTDKVAAVEFGVEIANTAGGEQTFTVDDYRLNFK